MSNEIDLALEEYGGGKRVPHVSTETSTKQYGAQAEPMEPAEAAAKYGTGRPYRDVLRARLID